MADDDVRHPIIVDTDARITDNIQLTTTNVFDILPRLQPWDSSVGDSGRPCL